LDNREPAIIYEDNHIIVVIKFQNVPTITDESGDESLQEQLKKFIKNRDNKQGEVFVGIVHRLDRVTGGVMVFAKTSKAASRLTAQITDRSFNKEYLAVVYGEPKQRSATLVNYLVKDETTNVVSVVPQGATGAKRAELKYKTIVNRKDMSLVNVELTTGRSHQIRVQMKHIGNPIFNDAKYSGRKARGDIALWSYKLSFLHPTTGDELKFIVNPPESGVWQNFEFNRKSHLSKEETK
jgi:23S rRNA pseudouridine1911/1915/1917 synthase